MVCVLEAGNFAHKTPQNVKDLAFDCEKKNNIVGLLTVGLCLFVKNSIVYLVRAQIIGCYFSRITIEKILNRKLVSAFLRFGNDGINIVVKPI